MQFILSVRALELIKNCLINQMVKGILQTNFNEQKDFGSFSKAENVNEDISLNLDKINTLKLEGYTLKEEAICKLLDISPDMIDYLLDMLKTSRQGNEYEEKTVTVQEKQKKDEDEEK